MNVKTEYNWKRNRADAVVYLQPDDFIFNGENHSSKYWVDLIDSLCKILKEKDSQKMDEFLEDEKNRSFESFWKNMMSSRMNFSCIFAYQIMHNGE